MYSSDISSGDGVYVGFLDYIGYTKNDYQGEVIYNQVGSVTEDVLEALYEQAK